ncbi:hypothetical protein ACFVKB_47315 [Rhodococcus sp. NPDC127530]|uniref:hypothetical protein n=1 Tax=unclassified Rhodococcus (in: high G+C Gram-positive bacteria) TaxID=192944 RepID=UPI0036349D2C
MLRNLVVCGGRACVNVIGVANYCNARLPVIIRVNDPVGVGDQRCIGAAEGKQLCELIEFGVRGPDCLDEDTDAVCKGEDE